MLRSVAIALMAMLPPATPALAMYVSSEQLAEMCQNSTDFESPCVAYIAGLRDGIYSALAGKTPCLNQVHYGSVAEAFADPAFIARLKALGQLDGSGNRPSEIIADLTCQ